MQKSKVKSLNKIGKFNRKATNIGIWGKKEEVYQITLCVRAGEIWL